MMDFSSRLSASFDEPVRLVPLLKKLYGKLAEYGYELIRGIPLRRYPSSRHLEVYERLYAPKEQSRVFQVSSAPEAERGKICKDRKELELLYRFLFLNQPASVAELSPILGGSLVQELVEACIFLDGGDRLQSLFRIVPFGGSFYITSAFDRGLAHFTYLSYDSFILVWLIAERHRDKGCILDYCCGVGFVGLEAMVLGESLLGVDINPWAVRLARLNALVLDRENCEFIVGDKPPEDGRFETIVCNPPFIFYPERTAGSALPMDSDGGGLFGLEITLDCLRNLAPLLSTNGHLFLITRSPVIEGRDYLFEMLQKEPMGLSGEYVHLANALEGPSKAEMSLGIDSYRHILLDLYRTGSGGDFVDVPAKGEEVCRYAF